MVFLAEKLISISWNMPCLDFTKKPKRMAVNTESSLISLFSNRKEKFLVLCLKLRSKLPKKVVDCTKPTSQELDYNFDFYQPWTNYLMNFLSCTWNVLKTKVSFIHFINTDWKQGIKCKQISSLIELVPQQEDNSVILVFTDIMVHFSFFTFLN